MEVLSSKWSHPLEIGPFQTLDSLDGVDHGLLGVVVFAMLYIYIRDRYRYSYAYMHMCMYVFMYVYMFIHAAMVG